MIKSTLRPLGLKWLTPAGLGFIPFFQFYMKYMPLLLIEAS